MVDMDSLLLTTSDEEIRREVFSMALLKAPSADGFHVKGAPLDPKMNKTLLVLLAKVQGLKRITQFMSISLCTVVYKIVTKMIVNRQKPLMVKLKKSNQARFVSERNINDNIIVA
ncbi:reverse transcriptase [Gossypium australe]|uniref:Reverse transcriptase n=1 Tax=Gossypium australe TaxID=47621 RepID=A0A5B6UW67_9ROSI|nr:reverse transcriptase [Gossypium australe]